MFAEAAGIHRKVLGADNPSRKSHSDRLYSIAIGCTVESKYKQIALLNKEMTFEHDDFTLDTCLSHPTTQPVLHATRLPGRGHLDVQAGFTRQAA